MMTEIRRRNHNFWTCAMLLRDAILTQAEWQAHTMMRVGCYVEQIKQMWKMWHMRKSLWTWCLTCQILHYCDKCDMCNREDMHERLDRKVNWKYGTVLFLNLMWNLKGGIDLKMLLVEKARVGPRAFPSRPPANPSNLSYLSNLSNLATSRSTERHWILIILQPST